MDITAAISRPDTEAPVLEPVRLEPPRPGEMLIRIAAVGICHTDIHAHEGRLAPLPIALGHEGAGVVEALGDGVQGFEPGDHVLLSGSSCGECPNCLNNHPTYCDRAMPLTFGGQRPDGSTALCCGGEAVHSHFFGQSSFATYAVVPQRTAFKVARDLPLDTLAPLGCGVITGAGAVLEALKPGFGDSIAVFGSGAVGLSAIMAARLTGALRIVAVDIKPDRLDLARDMGATDYFLADEDDLADKIRQVTGRGMDYTLNTTTAAAVHTLALDCLAMNGTAGFVSAPRGEWTPPMFQILAGGRQLRGILGGDAAPRLFLPKLIAYWQQGRFPFHRLIQTYPFEQIGQAFADLKAGKVIKPVLLMPHGESA
ncbi:NAD(P)-dependent alcohol dehydrogenase [Altericroceibacterium spongiae]|uniref:NAD(P)-dependent alcohol dehydrogenase n=2 Tax=Altericroceibacterium spongiae TaxID=2320269 RepID=A0A420ESI3_9SPHN|nr:NAD(P)-dependent alcohol dehydrogenase [Altericroceibacterium spongiae]